ncbi:hypothetical protein SLE2022_406540, partial [Rubroshorea leprosula]
VWFRTLNIERCVEVRWKFEWLARQPSSASGMAASAFSHLGDPPTQAGGFGAFLPEAQGRIRRLRDESSSFNRPATPSDCRGRIGNGSVCPAKDPTPPTWIR